MPWSGHVVTGPVCTLFPLLDGDGSVDGLMRLLIPFVLCIERGEGGQGGRDEGGGENDSWREARFGTYDFLWNGGL